MKTSVSANKLGTQEIQLSNGSVLYHRYFEGAPRIALGIYTYGGNRIEAKPGLADMVDDLLCEGTHKRTAEQIAVEMDGLSLDMDTDTRRDYSTMTATFLEEDLEPSIDLISDMFCNSSFVEFEKEKVRLHGEMVMDLDSPRQRSHDLLMTALFQGSPYQASHTNILKTIPQLTSVAPLMDHYKAVYQPENTMFCVVGDVKADVVQQQLEQFFIREKGRNYAQENPPQHLTIQENQYITAAKDDSNQLHVYKGWFAPEMSHPDYPAVAVLNTILGGAGLTSRLFIELRDKQGLAYTVRSQYEASRYAGLFLMYIGTEPNNREKVLKGFEIECQKLMDHPVSHQELEEAKENIMGRRVVFLETASQQCSYVGNQVALGLTLDQVDQLIDQVQAVTALQVQEAAQKYFSQPSIITAVGPSQYL